MPIAKPLRYISNAYLNRRAEYCPFKWNEIVPLAGRALDSFCLLFPHRRKTPSTLKESWLTVSEAEWVARWQQNNTMPPEAASENTKPTAGIYVTFNSIIHIRSSKAHFEIRWLLFLPLHHTQREIPWPWHHFLAQPLCAASIRDTTVTCCWGFLCWSFITLFQVFTVHSEIHVCYRSCPYKLGSSWF